MTYLPDEPAIRELLSGMPVTVPEIVKIVQNNIIHIFWAERMGVELPEERLTEVNIRSAAEKLRRIHKHKPVKLTTKRQYTEKLVGNCRDFTIITVALLRRAGIPARARCGFGAYFSVPGEKLRYMDHWVVEYWNRDQERWVMVDSQLDDYQQGVLKLGFDPLDVPSDRFITGGAAWTMCREGGADPDTFGIFNMSGMGFIRGDMIRDLAALGKTPLLPWDGWGAMLDEETRHLELMDRVAKVTVPGTTDYEEIAELNQNPLLKVSETIVSWMGDSKPVKVKLSDVTEKII
jgi:hypothetical protein